MAEMKHRAKNEIDIDKKPRIYFTCHPDDFDSCFEKICSDILKTHDCVIYYTPDMRQSVREKETDIGRNNLFVIPVTEKLLTTSNRAMDEDFPYAVKAKMPILPILTEEVSVELYSRPENFGDLQYLNSLSFDNTEISYEEKLRKYLDSVLISDETAKRIRAAFDAYIFLSYRKKDRKHANELMRLIHSNPECRDIAIWFDEFLTPGEDFNKNIEKMLDDCELFTLLVTPHIFEKVTDEKGVERDNFVISIEIPAAQRKKEEKGTEIFAVEMEDTDKNALSEIKIDDCVNARDEAAFRERLLKSVSKIAKTENDGDPMHNFLIGLAYLEGIDVEVDRSRAAELITGAAESGLPEAMAKLISMYTDGIGVERSREQVSYWSQRLAEYYFGGIFSKKNTIKSKKKISDLFGLYENEKYERVIRQFLLKADKHISAEVMKELADIILSESISEYTLLFEISEEMSVHKSDMQIFILRDILLKSSDGAYPPYGPLFWYVPEYSLYKELLFALRMLTENEHFTKALALTRDVCYIYGHFNEVCEITTELDLCFDEIDDVGKNLRELNYEIARKISNPDGRRLLSFARLHGVRKGLCELFFEGKTDSEVGEDVYPRCFNIREAKSWKDIGCGIHGRMTVPFEDELGLYTHESYTELNGEYIGIVSVPYDKEMTEEKLNSKSCRKLSGIIFTPTENTVMNGKPNINDNHIRVIFVPENIQRISMYCRRQDLTVVDDGIIYFYNKVFLPEGITKIDEDAFYFCSSIESANLPKSLLKIESHAFWCCSSLSSISLQEGIISIGYGAFSECALTEITFPDSLRSFENEVFSRCTKLERIENCPFGYSLDYLGLWNREDCSITYRKRILQTIDIPYGTTEIYEAQFYNNKELYKVNIPNSVKRINKNAFCGCISLESIELPDSITEIDKSVFSGCSSLKSIKLPDSATEIGDFAFEECSSLKSIKLPDNITKINAGTFKRCSSLESIKLPEGITEICEDAFSRCSSLKSIEIPDSITEIGFRVFSECSSLESIELPEGITEIGYGAFMECSSLKLIELPEGVTEIGYGTFKRCSSLKSIKLSEGIKEIGDYVFSGCSSLESIELSEGITEIGEGAFSECSSLKSIKLPKKLKKIRESTFLGCKTLELISFSESINLIEDKTFAGCDSLKTIILPDNIQVLGKGVFSGCNKLKSIINCPKNYSHEYLGVSADCDIFYRKTSSKNVDIPHGTTEIPEWQFFGNSEICQINIPETVKYIGKGAFEKCTSLKTINFSEGILEIDDRTFYGCSSLELIRIPNSVERIGGNAFSSCEALKSVKLPEGITEIGEDAFWKCSSLESIELSEGITEINNGVFVGCSSLESIIIPKSVKRIGLFTFCGCEALKKVKLSEGITEIGDFAFEECSSLNSITIPDSVKRIGSSAFDSCKALKKVKLPEGITEIGFCAFFGCCSLESIKLPELLCEIGRFAFGNCKSLEEITIPKSVQKIDNDAFAGCTGLKRVTISVRFEEDFKGIFGSDFDLSQVTINLI